MSIRSQLSDVRETLPEGVTLVAVSKTHAPALIEEAYAAGQRIFGESRPQELAAKYEALPKDIEWHMIGHLQTNKVKYIIEDMALIHSVDSLHLAQEIDRHAARVGKVQNILIEVNVGAESSKSGVSPDALEELLLQIGQMSNVHVQGLMAIPPAAGSEKFLCEMQELYLDISAKKLDNIDMKILSMGMSGDYAAAIRYGSTMVRIGSALFGARKYT
mgnify:CR=1 FL=1